MMWKLLSLLALIFSVSVRAGVVEDLEEVILRAKNPTKKMESSHPWPILSQSNSADPNAAMFRKYNVTNNISLNFVMVNAFF